MKLGVYMLWTEMREAATGPAFEVGVHGLGADVMIGRPVSALSPELAVEAATAQAKIKATQARSAKAAKLAKAAKAAKSAKAPAGGTSGAKAPAAKPRARRSRAGAAA